MILGFQTQRLDELLEILLAGRKINSFIDRGEEYYVILQAKKEFRNNMKDILSFEVKNNQNELVRLENLLNFKESAEAKRIK